MARRIFCLVAGLLFLLLTEPYGEVFGQKPPGCCGCKDIVYVVNGSGGDTSLTENVTEVINGRHYALAVKTLYWCRNDKMVRDHLDYEAQIAGASRLAENLACLRKEFPTSKLYVIGHSAGNHVALVAAGMLPQGIVDRLILLAPAVSYNFDLRPALRSSREGIDCFFSCQDQIVSIGAELYWTADRKPTLAAGEIGFARLPPGNPDAHLYCLLRQYPWNRSMVQAGHCGGHYGSNHLRFLDAYVLPVMLSPR